MSKHIDVTEPLLLELGDFCKAIRFGVEPRSSRELGSDVVRMIEAVDDSLANGGLRVPVAPALVGEGGTRAPGEIDAASVAPRR